MKDFCKIEENKYGTKYYYNENNQFHRLTGPAAELVRGDKRYCINNICYMYFYKNSNKLYIYPRILKFILEYEKYIKQNIKDLIQEYNPKIKSSIYFTKEQINELPDWIKDLIIL